MRSKLGDKIYTPVNIAKEIIKEFQPTGKILDPCRGTGAFYDNYPENCEKDYCEIDECKDFFTYNEHVDWIISNPPYSILTEWLEHSFEIADNVVYLIPIDKLLTSNKRIKTVFEFGGIEKILFIDPKKAGFPFGWATGAVYFKKDYTGPIEIKYLEENIV